MEFKPEIKYLIGIDEAGRGALAGPVAVGMFVWPVQFGDLKNILADYPLGKDSKKLTPKQREKWFGRIGELCREYQAQSYVSFVSNTYIDRAGIVPAVRQGIKACFDKISFLPEETIIKLDGGLSAPKEFMNQETIIKGDEKELVISLASILAKVSRDHKMIALSQKYQGYNLEKHNGYGTAEHYSLLDKNGPSIIHRQSYLA